MSISIRFERDSRLERGTSASDCPVLSRCPLWKIRNAVTSRLRCLAYASTSLSSFVFLRALISTGTYRHRSINQSIKSNHDDDEDDDDEIETAQQPASEREPTIRVDHSSVVMLVCAYIAILIEKLERDDLVDTQIRLGIHGTKTTAVSIDAATAATTAASLLIKWEIDRMDWVEL